MKLFDMLRDYGDPTTIISKLRDDGLLARSLRCNACGTVMRERKANKADGIQFECPQQSCRKSASIRKGSFFENARLNLCECMLFMHLWSKDYTERLICDDFPFSNKTVVDWSRFCREACVYHFENDGTIIGGHGTIVEIDETMVVKRKNNQGRVLTAGWLFGGIERRVDSEFKCFIRLVYNRSAPHLTHLICQHVAQGTHIITDGWSAYSGLRLLGYTHSVVIHEENFVSPDDNTVHTQTIESTWSSLKRFIRRHGTNKGSFYLEYISEYVFRRKHHNVFSALIDTIRQMYNLQSE